MHALQAQLPERTSGEGVLESTFDSYRPVRVPMAEGAAYVAASRYLAEKPSSE